MGQLPQETDSEECSKGLLKRAVSNNICEEMWAAALGGERRQIRQLRQYKPQLIPQEALKLRQPFKVIQN